jgi:hypothetical protein
MILGLICGIAFGALAVLTMIPLQFPDKKAAMLGAFFNRFAIGFLIGSTHLPMAPWLGGLVVSLLVSLPSAIISKAYAPILGLGAVGGVVIGFIVGKWGV